jgi:hypothetical protein
MLVGISVLGIVSAGMAASLVKRGIGAGAPASTPASAPANDAAPAVATDASQEVLKEIAELKSMVAALQSQLAKPGAPLANVRGQWGIRPRERFQIWHNLPDFRSLNSIGSYIFWGSSSQS